MPNIGLLFVATLLAQHGELRSLDNEPTLTAPDSAGKKKHNNKKI